MAIAPFVWGDSGQAISPEQAKQRRKVADALRQQAGYVPKGPWSLLGSLASEGVANYRDSVTDDNEADARKTVADALAARDYMGVMGSDWASPGQQQVASAMQGRLWDKEDRANDPLRQMQIEKGQLELDAMRNPGPAKPIEVGGVLLDPVTYQPIFDSRATAGNKPVEVNGQLVDPTTGAVIGDYRDQQAPAKPIEVGGVLVDPVTYKPVFDSRQPGEDGFTLSPGQQRFDAQGNPIAGVDAPVEPPKAPTVQKVLLEDGSEMAVQWDGASEQWIPINAPEGGGTLKPGDGLTEGQAKLTLFQSLQTETQPVLLDLETQFNPGNLADATARSTPIAGNFFQSEQGQIYNSAATAWAEGALRIATGAAATPEEMERTKRAYFAQPGDTPNTIEFKAQMREMYNRAIQRSLGQETSGALPKPSEFAQQISPTGGTGGQSTVAPSSIDALLEKYQ